MLQALYLKYELLFLFVLILLLYGKNGVDCYSKNGHAVTVLTRQS